MSDRFHPISMEQLSHWVFTELEAKNSLFNVPRRAFFVPRPDQRYRTRLFGQTLETPFGVAAGPHTQMAQNIITAWLVGARLLELKTVQTLDELDVNKPCIDLEDEGYNVEWSQELRVHQSFDEYLRAWVLIHALHHRLGFPGERPGMVFNMSVGYNLEGILKPNVQWYLDTMADASAYLPAYVDIVARDYPAIRDVDIPSRLSDSVTLSTMHGCPPEEIEKISLYLIEERGLHTTVKCNPTLLGADRVRAIVNEDLGFTDVPIPDSAFGHDLKYDDAVPMFHNLRRAASRKGVAFGLKLTNTLEVENWRTVFERDSMMYLSGRALHAVTTNLAATLAEEFHGGLPMSFAGGADCVNVADLLRSGLETITVCSDLLKTGGYLRMLQYMEHVDAAFDEVGALDTIDFACKAALREPGVETFVPLLRYTALTDSGLDLSEAQADGLLAALRAVAPGVRVRDAVASWAAAEGLDATRAAKLTDVAVRALIRINLRAYAASVRESWRYRKDSFRMDRSKTSRALGAFDCIQAPCTDRCAIDQAVPEYMRAVREGDLDAAIDITRRDNPLASVLGRVCDHLCETTCIRTHLDQPLAIRHMKRFIMDAEADRAGTAATASPDAALDARVAIIGAGPAGLAAARELAAGGVKVTIFEAQPYPGGMVGGAIPSYRLPQAQIDQDLAILDQLGVEIRCGMTAGRDFTLESLRKDGFGAVFVAVGAQLAKRLDLPGEGAAGIVDGITFLRAIRENHPLPVGARVGIVGAGDTAMDCARSAHRLGAADVAFIYRRTKDQMPADPEEIHESLAEGLRIIEFAAPVGLHVEDGRLAGVICRRTEYRGERDASGRKRPVEVPGSEFELPLDTLIVAVSQHAVLDFFDGEAPAITKAGYLETDPETYETSVAGVYAGGDVSAHGPSSIVQAASDGKRVARAIIGRLTGREQGSRAYAATAEDPIDVQSLVVRRARRDYRVPVRTVGVDARRGFEEPILGFTPEEARAEAARCLDCDVICSLCVGVCPNMALLTYESEPVRAALPSLRVAGDRIVAGERSPFAATQRLQIAVQTDFCNECGNCVTACPTSGKPYTDKPRLYLDRVDFEAQDANAFMLLGGGAMEGRFDGATHRIDVDGRIDYRAPGFRAALEPATLELLEASPDGAAEGDVLSLVPAAVMATLLAGLTRSMPHLPVASAGGTYVAAPDLAKV